MLILIGIDFVHMITKCYVKSIANVISVLECASVIWHHTPLHTHTYTPHYSKHIDITEAIKKKCFKDYTKYIND